jgi:hypothetical protein
MYSSIEKVSCTGLIDIGNETSPISVVFFCHAKAIVAKQGRFFCILPGPIFPPVLLTICKFIPRFAYLAGTYCQTRAHH